MVAVGHGGRKARGDAAIDRRARDGGDASGGAAETEPAQIRRGLCFDYPASGELGRCRCPRDCRQIDVAASASKILTRWRDWRPNRIGVRLLAKSTGSEIMWQRPFFHEGMS